MLPFLIAQLLLSKGKMKTKNKISLTGATELCSLLKTYQSVRLVEVCELIVLLWTLALPPRSLLRDTEP